MAAIFPIVFIFAAFGVAFDIGHPLAPALADAHCRHSFTLHRRICEKDGIDIQTGKPVALEEAEAEAAAENAP